jgi:hypothetical protein
MTDACDNYDGRLLGTGVVECVVPALNLMPGGYGVSLALKQGNERVEHIPDALRFQVLPSAINNNGKLPNEGVFILPCQWSK